MPRKKLDDSSPETTPEIKPTATPKLGRKTSVKKAVSAPSEAKTADSPMPKVLTEAVVPPRRLGRSRADEGMKSLAELAAEAPEDDDAGGPTLVEQAMAKKRAPKPAAPPSQATSPSVSAPAEAKSAAPQSSPVIEVASTEFGDDIQLAFRKPSRTQSPEARPVQKSRVLESIVIVAEASPEAPEVRVETPADFGELAEGIEIAFRAKPTTPRTVSQNTATSEHRSSGNRRNQGRGRERFDEFEASSEATTARIETPATPAELDLEGEDLPMPVFRSRGGATPADSERNVGRDRRERQQRSGRTPTEGNEVSPDVPVIEAEPVPTKIPRALIEIPEDAPQTVVQNGHVLIVRDHKILPPFFFYANGSNGIDATLEQVTSATESGLHLFGLQFTLELSDDGVRDFVKEALSQLGQIVRINAAAQVMLRIELKPARGWQENYPDAVNAFGSQSEQGPSLADDSYWGFVAELLATATKQIRASDFQRNLLGVHFEYEGFQNAERAVQDTSRAAKLKFRQWVRERYVNDEVMLHASWFDGRAKFETIELPNPAGFQVGPHRLLRSERKERPVVEHSLYVSDQTMARMADLAYAIKEASEGYFLIAVTYGATFEASHAGCGQFALGKLLRTPEIDIIASPPSYKDRQPGGIAAFAGPVDSFVLNGKLFLSLEDYRTSLGQSGSDGGNPIMRSPQALEAAQMRGIGSVLAHGGGVAWCDSHGKGWLMANSVWSRAKLVLDTFSRRIGTEATEPDVAVFVDERALPYLVGEQAYKILLQDVRDTLLQSGLSAGFFLLSDLAHREHFPECKCTIFLNAWDIRPELRSAIKARLQRDNKVLFWLYAAGLFDSGREALERAREVTGIAMKAQPFASKSGTKVLNRRHALGQVFPSGDAQAPIQFEPSYFAIPEDGIVLAEYSQTGLPSFVARDVTGDNPSENWTSVFLGEPAVNTALFRALAQVAGAHVWSFQDDVVHARLPYLTVHCKGDGPRTITLPGRMSAYNLNTNEWIVVDTHSLRFHGTDGTTHTFLVGSKTEIQRILELNLKQVLTIEALPPRESNIRVDATNLDVPLLRLDEWFEGVESTEPMMDEWFFRPRNQVEDEGEADSVESSDELGDERGNRRRGRRRRRRGDSAPDDGFEGVSSREILGSAPNELDMNIMFRKRD